MRCCDVKFIDFVSKVYTNAQSAHHQQQPETAKSREEETFDFVLACCLHSTNKTLLASRQHAHVERFLSFISRGRRKMSQRLFLRASIRTLNPLKTTINFHFNGTERESVPGMSKWKIKAMNSVPECIYRPFLRHGTASRRSKSCNNK